MGILCFGDQKREHQKLLGIVFRQGTATASWDICDDPLVHWVNTEAFSRQFSEIKDPHWYDKQFYSYWNLFSFPLLLMFMHGLFRLRHHLVKLQQVELMDWLTKEEEEICKSIPVHHLFISSTYTWKRTQEVSYDFRPKSPFECMN